MRFIGQGINHSTLVIKNGHKLSPLKMIYLKLTLVSEVLGRVQALFYMIVLKYSGFTITAFMFSYTRRRLRFELELYCKSSI